MSDPIGSLDAMPRMARAVVPGLPHHITQRGNRRQQTFFGSDDFLLYTALLADSCQRFGVDVWAYCLMPNHVHLIGVPDSADALRRALGEAHQRYTTHVNTREGWRGHLWQGRFSSFPMDDRYTVAAARYIELNPVRAGLAMRPEDYPWSSARAHLLARDDGLVRVAPLLERVLDWPAFLCHQTDPRVMDDFRRHQTTGRPLGTEEFISHLESLLGRMLRPGKPGPVPGRARGTRSASVKGEPLDPHSSADR